LTAFSNTLNGLEASLLRLHEICQYALRHPHRVGEREGASLLQVL
jgi:hypothetical protein